MGPSLRFPSPLIKPDVRISRIRLSDWLHRQGPRRRRQVHASKTQDAEFPEDHRRRRTVRVPRPGTLCRLHEEVPHAVIDVIVDRPIGRQPRAVAEVRRPTAQQAVQLVAHLRPRRPCCRAPAARRPSSLIRCTLFLDGLAPRYHWPSFR